MKFTFPKIFRKSTTKKEVANIQAWRSGSYMESKSLPMLLSTVYRCVDLISDSIACLPLQTYNIDKSGYKSLAVNHPVYRLLVDEPNSDMTRFTFFKTLYASVLLTGNGYAFIERDNNGNASQIYYLPSDLVEIVYTLDANGINRKMYQVTGMTELVEPINMIHVLNFSYDGIKGVSTLTHARQTLNIATNTEGHVSEFFESGANVTGVLNIETSGRLSKEQKEENYKSWQERINPVTGRMMGMVILEGNMHYQPIAVSPKDSQMLESRAFNVVDICRFFSVSPTKAFDLTNANFSTAEAMQLQYLSDTVLSVITKIEQEINRKIFLPSEYGHVRAEFDTSAMLRANKAEQGEWWNKMFQIGAATPNEARREMNLPRLDNGDKAFVQVNVQTLDNAVIPATPPDTQLVEDDGKGAN